MKHEENECNRSWVKQEPTKDEHKKSSITIMKQEPNKNVAWTKNKQEQSRKQ